MNMDYLKKALLIGIPAGLVSGFAIILIRTISAGGSYVSHLTSDFGILVLVLLPIAWVFHQYKREREKAENKAAEAELEARRGRSGDGTEN